MGARGVVMRRALILLAWSAAFWAHLPEFALLAVARVLIAVAQLGFALH